ncbi:MAG: transporter substrate-binding domain-containing protein [Eubacterium sp.]|nr:transporter substrate-binding domain-containing protein [Eubacterium sp.]
MRKKIAVLLSGVMLLSMVLTGCGGSNKSEKATEAPAADASADLVYAVEAVSAGAAVAAEKGFNVNEVASQADALMEVQSGTSDAAIIDLLMAGAMIGEGTSYPNLTHTDELTTEEYGVGCRKGSDLASFINSVLYNTYSDGTLTEIATQYGVQEALVEQQECAYEPAASDSDVEAIKAKGSLIVGITDFAPMDYKDDNGEWIGFDADMAKIVGEELGVKVEFTEIDWDNKIMELDSGNIDVVWNGMTLTDEVTSAMSCTNPYCNNAQVVVVPAQ